MVLEFNARENTSHNTDRIPTGQENQQLNLLSAMEDGLAGGLAAGFKSGLKNQQTLDASAVDKTDSDGEQKFDSNTINQFWKSLPELGSKAIEAILPGVLSGKDHLPSLDFEDMQGFLKGGCLTDITEAKAKRAADIIADDGDLGSDKQKKEIADMFEEAYKKGGDAVERLVKMINEELEKRGSDVRVSTRSDFDPTPNPWVLKKYGSVVVTKGGAVEDEVAVYKDDPMSRNALTKTMNQ
jgi:polyhydroxyalkanoate synthesis regulator phasin